MVDDPHLIDPLGARLIHRLMFFSDAVFAIVLTLLVLDLRPPHDIPPGQLLEALAAMAPDIGAFLLSFGVVSIFWVAHVSIIRSLIIWDWATAWFNLLFLLTITLAPFISSLIGEYGPYSDAWRIYCGVLIAMGITESLLFAVAARDHGRLVGGIGAREYWSALLNGMSPALAFAIGLALSCAGYRYLAGGCYILIPFFLLLWRLIFRAPRATSKPEPLPPG